MVKKTLHVHSKEDNNLIKNLVFINNLRWNRHECLYILSLIIDFWLKKR